MRKRNIIQLTLVRDKVNTYLKLKTAPELEQVFRDLSLEEFGEDNTETSTRWSNDSSEGLKFYKRATGENDNKIMGEVAFNDFGKSLMDRDNGRVNIALLRAVGSSGKGGVILKTSELIGYEELNDYAKRLAEWSKDFYRDYIKRSKLTATISIEV